MFLQYQQGSKVGFAMMALRLSPVFTTFDLSLGIKECLLKVSMKFKQLDLPCVGYPE